MYEETKSKKISGVKKNISIFKKDKTVKIKPNSIPQKKSMDNAIIGNEVLLWGLNRIDSILLSPYEKNYQKYKTKSVDSINTDEFKTQKNNIDLKIDNLSNKTTDKEYISTHKYDLCDLDFLNMEYDRIENKISQMTELTDEYNNLLDLQDSLTDLINELEYEAKNNKSNANDSNANDSNTNDSNTNENCEIKIEVEIKIKSTKPIKPKKLKPYYWIGLIPDGYREATEEEAIVNKKVSLFGKKRVQRELYSLYDITGTIYMDCEDPIKLNQQIMSLKGKLKYYKRELQYNNVTLDSDTISPETEIKIKNKIAEINNCHKKTLDILNLHIVKYNKVKYINP